MLGRYSLYYADTEDDKDRNVFQQFKELVKVLTWQQEGLKDTPQGVLPEGVALPQLTMLLDQCTSRQSLEVIMRDSLGKGGDAELQGAQEGVEAVHLMTMHKAKVRCSYDSESLACVKMIFQFSHFVQDRDDVDV